MFDGLSDDTGPADAESHVRCHHHLHSGVPDPAAEQPGQSGARPGPATGSVSASVSVRVHVYSVHSLPLSGAAKGSPFLSLV